MNCTHLEATQNGIIVDIRNNIHYRYVRDLIEDTQCERVCGANKCKFITILETRKEVQKPKPIEEPDKDEPTLQELKRDAGKRGKR